ncbi:calcium/sodium antiporter [Candidatus Micrarchaeota archaeon]|nr:calcium/sodium antiporter [Candidatus Micrarchaeota archaeon]
MWFYIILLAASLILLIKGADFLIDGATYIAEHFGIPPLIIGLTIVAFGTSLPELSVNVFSALSSQGGISFGNIFGSNIANILLILGVAAFINPFKVKSSTMWKEIPFAILALFILFLMVNDSLFIQGRYNTLERNEGLILLALFFVFLYYTFGVTKMEVKKTKKNIKVNKTKSALLIILGIIFLFIGGKYAVESATNLMFHLNISGEVIGLTVIALGTSLPELITSIVSIHKKNTDILIGNILGSNIFNILFVLGITSLISPVVYNASLNLDLIVALVSLYLLFVVLFTGKKARSIEKWEALVLIICYGLYILSIFYRIGLP